jgi:hypothetical protein
MIGAYGRVEFNAERNSRGRRGRTIKVTLNLSETQVTHLLSPPMTPRYNGSQEAGIGAFKTRTLHIAAARGRPGDWTCDDVEAARIEANVQARPRGRGGAAPIDLWEQRAAISDGERAGFVAAVQTAMQLEQRRMIDRIAATQDVLLGAIQRATVARRAIRRVLLELGYLRVRRTAN